jgi:hypothetical protein
MNEGGECLDDVVHIAKDRALRLVTNQQVPTPQAIGTWLRHLGKDNQGIKALRKANKTLLKATLNNCKNILMRGCKFKPYKSLYKTPTNFGAFR